MLAASAAWRARQAAIRVLGETIGVGILRRLGRMSTSLAASPSPDESKMAITLLLFISSAVLIYPASSS